MDVFVLAEKEACSCHEEAYAAVCEIRYRRIGGAFVDINAIDK